MCVCVHKLNIYVYVYIYIYIHKPYTWNQVFREADSDDDGFIHFDDFAKVLIEEHILQ